MADLPMADRHETVLPPIPEEIDARLADALASPEAERRGTLAEVVADHPTLVAGWSELALLGADPIERYAYARVGYHRGLDALRANGWGGRGFVRWSQPTNRALLTCLVRLRSGAAEIGEVDEVARLTDFLHELDPDWDETHTA